MWRVPLLAQCADTDAAEILAPEAVKRLADSLATPLQIEQYLMRVLDKGYRVGQRPVSAELVESVLIKGIDDLEPTLVRHGYTAKVLTDMLNIKPAEARAFLKGQLPPTRMQDLQAELRVAGLPV